MLLLRRTLRAAAEEVRHARALGAKCVRAHRERRAELGLPDAADAARMSRELQKALWI